MPAKSSTVCDTFSDHYYCANIGLTAVELTTGEPDGTITITSAQDATIQGLLLPGGKVKLADRARLESIAEGI